MENEVNHGIDYAEAIAHLSQADPVLGGMMQQLGPCTLGADQTTGDLLACLCRAVIYQQLSGKAASAIQRKFLALYPTVDFPSAEAILQTPDETLRSAGISRSKAIYLKDVATHVAAGLPSLEQLAELDDEAIIQTLTAIKGIGRWSVQMLLIFRLHRWDVLPVDDLGIRAGIRKVYGLPELPDKKAVLRLGEPWQPYRTVASWYLWRSKDTA
jgi:DNA-3-methyladenine glycosylase II